MFWKFDLHTSSHLDTLLEKEDLSLPGVLGEVTWGSQNGTLSAERDPIPLHNPPITSSLTVLPQASWVAPKGPGSVPLNRGRLQICLSTENGSISHTLRHPRGSLNLFSIHLKIVCTA